MALDVDGLRQYVSSSLEDSALEGLLTVAYQAIDSRIGEGDADAGELLSASGPLLMLARRASAITSITEIRGFTNFLLEEDDFELRPGGQTLRRLSSGTNPAHRWRGMVDVRYTPFLSDADRDRVAVALVELDLNHSPGLTGQQVGDWQETYAANSVFNYQIERESILDSLNGQTLVLL